MLSIALQSPEFKAQNCSSVFSRIFPPKQQELINWAYDILINSFTPAGMSKNRFNHQATYTEKTVEKIYFKGCIKCIK